MSADHRPDLRKSSSTARLALGMSISSLVLSLVCVLGIVLNRGF